MPRRKAQRRREKELRQTLEKKADRYCVIFQVFSYGRKTSKGMKEGPFISCGSPQNVKIKIIKFSWYSSHFVHIQKPSNYSLGECVSSQRTIF